MQWSKLKQRVESCFAPCLEGRVELRKTSYRRTHDREGRCWITIDGAEVANFCTLVYYQRRNELEQGLLEANRTSDWADPAPRAELTLAKAAAEAIVGREGTLSQAGFERALEAYLLLGIGRVMASDSVVHRALGVIDRRMGKRRLQSLCLQPGEHPLVVELYGLRLAAERLAPPAWLHERQKQTRRQSPGVC